MKFGIHSLLFRETFVEKDLPLLDKCKALGFDAVEIIPFDYDGFPAEKVRTAAANLGLTIHIGYGMPNHLNLISPDPVIRRYAIDFTKRLVDLSNDAGAEVLTGLMHCAWGHLSGKMPTSDEWNWSVEGMKQIAGYAQRASKLVIGVEVVNRFESHFINTAADAVRYVQDVGLPNVKVHLDTFHMIREETDIPAAVKETGSYLGYVHACENQRGIPGTGIVPWRPFFEALKQIGYDSYVTIESFDPGLESVVKLCCIWRRLADSPEQLAGEGLKFVKGVYAQVYGVKAGTGN